MNHIINDDPRRISEDQLYLLVDVLQQIQNQKIPGWSQVFKTVFSRTPGRTPIQVHIKNPVHYSQYDMNGPYHFNIQVGQQSIIHVYVEPISDPSSPIAIDSSGTVTLIPVVHFRWLFRGITL